MVSNFRVRDIADEMEEISNGMPGAQLTINTTAAGYLTADKTSKSSPDSGMF